MKKLIILNLNFKITIYIFIYIFGNNSTTYNKTKDNKQKVDQAYFRQFKLVNLKVDSLLNSITREIRNCDYLDKKTNCLVFIGELNDSTTKMYIAQSDGINKLNDIEGIFRLNEINFILFKSEKILKYFKIDSLKPSLIIKKNPINYFYEFPEWAFYIEKDSVIKGSKLNFECFDE